VVTYTDPGATDNCEASPVVVCSPSSGSTFASGTTAVTCTATDACGNSDAGSQCTFDVTVNPVNDVDVEAELVGVNAEVSRCVHFVTDDCGNTADVVLSFTDHDSDGGSVTPVRAIDTIQIDCGVSTSLCAKDEQHTLYGTATLTDMGTYYVAGLLSLDAGDTDNDSDVDINDVTYLIYTYGDPAADGGCAWDGTRDADFSNSLGAGSEDYTFLVQNWHQYSTCDCTALIMAGRVRIADRAPLDTRSSVKVSTLRRGMAARVDLNADGVFDVKDVRAFELRHGLGHALSSKMHEEAIGAKGRGAGRRPGR
jgi:hypothetical protein